MSKLLKKERKKGRKKKLYIVQETNLTLTSTENCKSLLALRTGLNSTCTTTYSKEKKKKPQGTKTQAISTFELHLRAISCSTPIEKEGGT